MSVINHHILPLLMMHIAIDINTINIKKYLKYFRLPVMQPSILTTIPIKLVLPSAPYPGRKGMFMAQGAPLILGFNNKKTAIIKIDIGTLNNVYLQNCTGVIFSNLKLKISKKGKKNHLASVIAARAPCAENSIYRPTMIRYKII